MCIRDSLTLPLSAGRMWSMAHGGKNLPDVYSCIAGGIMASTGFIDALLYTLTRKQLLKGSKPNGSRSSKSSDAARGGYQTWPKRGASVFSTQDSTARALRSHASSIQQEGGITQTKTVTITGQRVYPPTPTDSSIELTGPARSLPRDPSTQSSIDPSRSSSIAYTFEPIICGGPQPSELSYSQGQLQPLDGLSLIHISEPTRPY